MIYNMYSVQDRCANEFFAPRIFTNEPVAVRDFTNMVNVEEKGNLLNSHAGDFSLYYTGEFDSDTGIVSPAKTPKFIVNGMAVKGVKFSDEEY